MPTGFYLECAACGATHIEAIDAYNGAEDSDGAVIMAGWYRIAHEILCNQCGRDVQLWIKTKRREKAP